LNELLLCTRRAHLQRIIGRRMTADDRDVARAALIRERLWPIIRTMDFHEVPDDKRDHAVADDE